MNKFKNIEFQIKQYQMLEAKGELTEYAKGKLNGMLEVMNIATNNDALGDVINSLPTKDEFVSKGWSIARSSQYLRRKSVQNKVDDIYYSGWMDCYDWMINNEL